MRLFVAHGKNLLAMMCAAVRLASPETWSSSVSSAPWGKATGDTVGVSMLSLDEGSIRRVASLPGDAVSLGLRSVMTPAASSDPAGPMPSERSVMFPATSATNTSTAHAPPRVVPRRRVALSLS